MSPTFIKTLLATSHCDGSHWGDSMLEIQRSCCKAGNYRGSRGQSHSYKSSLWWELILSFESCFLKRPTTRPYLKVPIPYLNAALLLKAVNLFSERQSSRERKGEREREKEEEWGGEIGEARGGEEKRPKEEEARKRSGSRREERKEKEKLLFHLLVHY